MADSDKDILITPNTGAATDPSIVFSSGATGGDDVTLFVTDDGTITTLSIEGSAGQLFSVSNDLTGIIFSVNDISGIPSLEVNADGTVSIAEFDGDVGIGTSSPSAQLHVIADSATTNADIPVIRITSTSTGTPATGIGPSIEFESETAAGSPGNLEIGGVLALESTDVTATTEDFDFVFSTMAAGAAAAERMRITSTGNVTATSFGGITEANLVDKTAAETITGAWDFNAGATVLNGLDFGSVVGASATDLTEHIALWGSTYGFNVTSNTLNVTAAGTNTLSSTSSLITSRVAHDFDGNVTGSGSNTLSGFLSIEGITSANLVDKSANETITGTWTIDKIITGSNSVATETDILLTDNGNIGATQSMNFITDTDNTQTGTAFKWLTNAPGETSATTVMTLNENGNLVGVGTLTGFTSISAATIGGITEANLVDKTATETISGSWNYTAVPTVSGGKVVYDQGTLDGADFDLIDATNEEGIYTWTTTATNSPFNYGTLLAFHDSGQINQLAFGGAGFGQMSIRRRDSGTWYAWSDFVSVDQSHTPVNNRVATWVSATELDSSANLTFDGSTLNVTGTVAATTVTGANVTSGADPGHTHGAGSVPNHDSLTGFVANEHIDWTADSGSQIQVDNLAVDRSYSGVSTVTPQYSYVGYDRFSGGIDNDLILDAGIFGLASGDTNGAGNGTFNPMLVMRNSSDVRVQASFPRENSNPIAYRGYHTAAWQTWHYTGWTTTEANADLTLYPRKAENATITGSWNFNTATNTVPFYVSRLGTSSEALRFAVDDNSGYIILNQDEVDGTAHGIIFDVSSSSSGEHSYIFRDNGGNQVIWDMTNNTYTFNGAIEVVAQTDHGPDFFSGGAQIWARSESLGDELYYTAGDNNTIDHTLQNVMEAGYQFSSTTTAADPGAGLLRFNNATPASVTNLYIDDSESTGKDASYLLSNLADGDIIKVRDVNAAGAYLVASVNGTPTDNTGWWTVPVTVIHSGSLPTNLGPIQVDVEWSGSQGGGSGITGTVANDQVVTGTGASTVDSSANLTFNGSTLAVTGNVTATTSSTFSGGIAMSNANITGVGALSFNDPGPGEGISWTGGNWSIYDSPDDLVTNTAGNLQFVTSGTRMMTVGTDGIIDINKEILIGADATQPWVSVDSTSSGDNWSAQGAGISVGESGKKGSAAIHLTYNGDGSGYLGMGTVDDTAATGGRPTYGHLDFTYNSRDVKVGGLLYPGNSAGTTGSSLVQSVAYIESADSQNYGSINVTGAAGSSGTYSGYSINRRVVFMNNNSTTSGFYNDTNNEWMITMVENGAVSLYHNNVINFATQVYSTTGNTSGAYVRDHANVTRDVGFNHVKEVAMTTSNITLDDIHAGCIIRRTGTSAVILTVAAGTAFPVGSMCTVLNHGTGGSLTISDGSEAMYIMDGSGSVVDSLGFTLPIGGVITIWRQGLSAYYVWGAGIP